VFTGCYTSLSRLKRRAVSSLAEVVQAEAASTCAWWWNGAPFPAAELREAWRNHLFNDFHDILPGSCTEPAERDALDQYGRASSLSREARLGAVASLNRGAHRTLYIPVTILNTNPSCTRVPVEVECMLDLRPKWAGTWHLALFSLDGKEIPCQEEQPESLLPFNGWRRKVSFFADLPHVGAARYELRIVEGPPRATDEAQTSDAVPAAEPAHLPTPFIQPIVVEDDGDAWGAGRWNYKAIAGRFEPIQGSSVQIHSGPVRRTVEAGYAWNKSSMTLSTTTYSGWPVTEFTVRVHWHEHRKRLKLAIPAGFKPESILCEVPGGAINRPADGEEHVHGRWCILRGTLDGRPAAMAVISSGQHGFDVTDGELRLSVLRSAAYCHEQGFTLTDPPARKYMDQGVHEFRLLVQCGTPEEILDKVSGLADWLNAPPAVYAHLPIGMPSSGKSLRSRTSDTEEFIRISSPNIRLTACKQSEDTRALILRLQETTGNTGTTTISLGGQGRSMQLSFSPFEIKTIRVNRNGRFHEVHMVEES
jgi:alpha-mannosidase